MNYLHSHRSCLIARDLAVKYSVKRSLSQKQTQYVSVNPIDYMQDLTTTKVQVAPEKWDKRAILSAKNCITWVTLLD